MNLLHKLQRHPVIIGMAAIVAGVGIFAGAMHAWGPSERVTFTMANPASYVTFNSITDNPNTLAKDERNFVQMRNYTDNGKFGENIELVAGKEYEVYVFYHNNASTTYNSAEHNYAGVAIDARMRVEMPNIVNAGESARVTGFVSAANAKHLDKNGTDLGKQVWDEAYGKNSTSGAMALRYVPNSAKITGDNQNPQNGKAISLDDLASSNGAKLGYNALDGKLPGCTEYSGYVTYRFVADQPNFEITKQVSVSGANQYGENVKVKPGDKVDFKIKYKNIGTVDQNNVVIKDVMPAGLTYVAGSTMYSSSKTNNQWTTAGSDKLTTDGINFGTFLPGGALYVKFTAKVNEDKGLCDTKDLVNTAKAITENGTKTDDASVTVDQKCEPPVEDKDVKVCEIATGKIITIKESELKANSELYADKDSDKCKKTPEPEDKDVTVCKIETGAIVTIKESELKANPKLYADKDSEKCKPTPPKPPVTPEEPVTKLPETGVDLGAAGSLVGAGALTYAAYAYYVSRRT